MQFFVRPWLLLTTSNRRFSRILITKNSSVIDSPCIFEGGKTSSVLRYLMSNIALFLKFYIELCRIYTLIHIYLENWTEDFHAKWQACSYYCSNWFILIIFIDVFIDIGNHSAARRKLNQRSAKHRDRMHRRIHRNSDLSNSFVAKSEVIEPAAYNYEVRTIDHSIHSVYFRRKDQRI